MESSHQLLAALADVPDVVMAVDTGGYITFANAAYASLLGVPVQRVLGRPLQEIEPDAALLRVTGTGLPILSSRRVIRSLGVNVVGSVLPLFDRQGVGGALAIFRPEEAAPGKTSRSGRPRSTAGRPGNTGAAAFERLVGTAAPLVEALRLANRVAATDATVLITGETGTGKQLLAEAIHQASRRAGGPFVHVNCAAIPDALLESELFGYEPGSFTGAAAGGRPGRWELAGGGTLFLDEVGEMSPAMQAKVLVAVQERTIERLGGRRPIPCDVRVICASHQDLPRMMAEGRFRTDLYYRIAVFPIRLPALCERPGDIPSVAEALITRIALKENKWLRLSPDAKERLVGYAWPGNVRELEHALTYAAILSDGLITPEHLPAHVASGLAPGLAPGGPMLAVRPGVPLKVLQGEVERLALRINLESTSNRSEAIRNLGISRHHFYDLLGRHGFTPWPAAEEADS